MSSVQTTEFVIPQRDDVTPTKYYCEENIWLLAKHVLDVNELTPGLDCYVVILSNPNLQVHLWKQDVSDYETPDFDLSVNDGLVFWDYHVFFITEHQNQTLVFDFNSTLPFPVPFSEYASKSIKHDLETPRYFKVIKAETYVRLFSSNRKHMQLSNGDWMKPPPPYEPILNKEKISNFNALISMENKTDIFRREVLNLEEFLAKFTKTN